MEINFIGLFWLMIVSFGMLLHSLADEPTSNRRKTTYSGRVERFVLARLSSLVAAECGLFVWWSSRMWINGLMGLNNELRGCDYER